MEPQKKPVLVTAYSTDMEKSHHDHHAGSTSHLFNPEDHKQERKLIPYSLYLMNNNWYADGAKAENSELQWTWPDYACGILAGILFFVGLCMTEVVHIYFGKTAVPIYLFLFFVIFFTSVASPIFSCKK